MIAYFVVGLILGPNALGILPDSESSRHFVEFGIVFLMFTIGLEFSLPKLNSMRNILFGLGGSQVLITLLVVIMCGVFLDCNYLQHLLSAQHLRCLQQR
jgi:CPA2 family monovalent cation:H+ antiporter-2